MREADEWQGAKWDPEPKAAGGGKWALFLFMAGYLVLTFLWRLFGPAPGCTTSSERLLEMFFGALMVVSLIGLRRSAAGDDESRQRIGGPVMAFGTLAGLGLLLMRLTGC